MEDRDPDTEGLVDVGDPFADFVHNDFIRYAPQSISDVKSPPQRLRRKPRKASIETCTSKTRPRKRFFPDPCSIQQAVSIL